MTALLWLRNDLRPTDNPALAAAAKTGKILPVFILDEVNLRPLGGASKWALHHALDALLEHIPVQIFKGNPQDVIPLLCKKHGIHHVFWNRLYTPDTIQRDKHLKKILQDESITVQSFKAGLLVEPWEVTPQSSAFYKVFTPFWRACLKAFEKAPPPQPLPAPHGDYITDASSLSLEALALLPTAPNWAEDFKNFWPMGEKAAHIKLSTFLKNNLKTYAEGRNQPGKPATSGLSPYLHWGCISPVQIYHATQIALEKDASLTLGAERFLTELGWREFSYGLLYHVPTLPHSPLRENFNHFKWNKAPDHLTAWQKGKTGYPIIDAGMCQLWHTGWMHNRVRMLTASFLVKNLLLPWQEGEAWFWDTLVDADPANNSASWQWVAGCGADASPYFRIFNPITQGEKFDPDGTYVRTWLPELAHLPAKYIHTPWQAPQEVLKKAGIILGQNYPLPIVDHKITRQEALKRYQQIKA